jgi:hypothetical protein
MPRRLLGCCLTAWIVACGAHAADRVVVRVAEPVAKALAAGPGAGRIVVFLKSVRSRERGQPADGPFFSDPQPIVSRAVAGLRAGAEIEVSVEHAAAWPGPIDGLSGTFEAQAVFKRNRDDAAVLAPGNLTGSPVEVTLRDDADDTVELSLDEAIEMPERSDSRAIAWIDEPSPMLTRALGRVVRHRAAVVFPPGYHDVMHPRRVWPTVYVVPGFGGGLDAAEEIARLLAMPGSDRTLPQAVHVVLDPSGPCGHHGFADSVMNGPRGAALVKELVPTLEERYRLVRSPEARLLTGHSSGGWSTLWLQLTNPDFFGGCWSSAPDPVDFSAFQLGDLYRDDNLFVDAEGAERGSFRRPVGPMEKVLMTVREEIGMERAIDPSGTSGQQWDAWQAMFSPPDASGTMPKRLADPATGAIDRALVRDFWSAYDIARLVEKRWTRLDPVLRTKVHVLVGDRDNFYLERAVRKLAAKIDALRAATGSDAPKAIGPDGCIEILPDATHDSAAAIARGRFALGMRAHLKRHGLGD